MLSLLYRKKHICILLISILIIAALLISTQKSDKFDILGRNSVNHDRCMLCANNLSEISSYIVIKMNDLSLKRAESSRVKTSYDRGCLLGFCLGITPIQLCLFISLLFYLCRAIRSNRLIIISYIHNLDGMKP